MRHQGSADEFLAKWPLAPGDMRLLEDIVGPGLLGLAVQFATRPKTTGHGFVLRSKGLPQDR
jgi:hypothetical protein